MSLALRRRARTIRPPSVVAVMPITAHSDGSGTAATAFAWPNEKRSICEPCPAKFGTVMVKPEKAEVEVKPTKFGVVVAVTEPAKVYGTPFTPKVKFCPLKLPKSKPNAVVFAGRATVSILRPSGFR